jgi:endoglucanase
MKNSRKIFNSVNTILSAVSKNFTLARVKSSKRVKLFLLGLILCALTAGQGKVFLKLNELADAGCQNCFAMLPISADAADIGSNPLIYPMQNHASVRSSKKDKSSRLPVAKPDYNYAEALQKSLYFYEAQRSGKLPAQNRVAWRADSALQDGADVGKDLSGGWYDAGDRPKFMTTISYTTSMLAWGAIEYVDAYKNSGQLPYLLGSLRWANDYLLKCFTNDRSGQYEFYTQVGKIDNTPRNDHSVLVPAEVVHQITDRPSYKINTTVPGSDVAGQSAAAMAASSIVFRQHGDIAYANLLLTKAKKMFAFADRYRGGGSHLRPDGSIDREAPYRDANYLDELIWGAVWLHKAELARKPAYNGFYLTRAEQIYKSPENGQNRLKYAAEHSWISVDKGALVLIAKLTDKTEYKSEVQNYLHWWSVGHNGERVKYTPGGLAWSQAWGSLRYSTTQAFLAFVYSDWVKDSTLKARYHKFAVEQVNYALGNNPDRRSYMVGFGQNPVRTLSNWLAYGAWAGFEHGMKNKPQWMPYPRHIQYGALAGGPDERDRFVENSFDYSQNESAIDYNAAFTGTLARMYREFGGKPLKGFPPKEKRDDEFFVEAYVLAAGDNYIEIKALVNNRSAWPARITDRLSFRYFFTLDRGSRPDSIDLSASSDQTTVTTKIKKYKGNIYYADIDLAGTKIFPGGLDQYDSWRPFFSKEVIFRLKNSANAWNPNNDWSYQHVRKVGTKPTKVVSIPVYERGVKIFGSEPG